MYEEIIKKIYEELERGNRVAMVTLTEVRGSSPGKQGAIMAYFKDGAIMGTVGGGPVEHAVIQKCIETLKTGIDMNFEYSLDKNSSEVSMKCGGAIKGYIKLFNPKSKLLIVGGGHVGHAIYNLSTTLDFHTIVVDDRSEFANYERFPLANEVYSGNISQILNKIELTDNTYVVIATRGFDKDLEALREIISNNVSYIGMIGSSKKWINLKDELINEGICEELLDRVYAPIGLNISSDKVEEIAFGILAEVLLVKNNGHLSHRKDKKAK